MSYTEKTILVIEDDPNTSRLISIYLEAEGFRAVMEKDGAAGLDAVFKKHPDLVVLDLMLPEMDGWEVCRQIRQKMDIPVIMLTARGDEIDRVAGLTLGADDYVVKPFSPKELMARIKAVLRRYAGAGQEKKDGKTIVFGRIRFETEKHACYLDGQPVSLTPHEYSLLEKLIRTPGRVFSRQELLDHLYPDGEVNVVDRVVDVHIGKIRQKIEKDPSKPEYILTIRGTGYRSADQGEIG